MGTAPELHRPLQLVLLSHLLYGLNAACLAVGAHLNLFHERFTHWLIPAMLIGPLVFFVLIRTGCSRHLHDRGLVLVQALYGVTLTVLAYTGATTESRAMVLVILPLIMMFGQFNFRPLHFAVITAYTLQLMVVCTLWRDTQPELPPTHGQWLQVVYAGGILMAAAWLGQIVSSLRAKLFASRKELAQAMERLQALATTDELTRLPNRRRMQDLLQEEARRQKRLGHQVCLALIDLDHFKRINDQHGHPAGDQVLQTFARAARQVFREVDTIGRWGGEEFLLVLPDSETHEAVHALERLRLQLAGMDVLPGVANLRITFSAGVAAHPAQHTVEHTIDLADRALYAAKSAGRNQTQIGENPVGETQMGSTPRGA